MKNILIIGAGGVSRVATYKIAEYKHFDNIVLASRTISKCNEIRDFIKERLGVEIKTASIDADNLEEVKKLIKESKADILLNVALPYQDLVLMDACSSCKIAYVDTANYEHPDLAKFEYKEQWARNDDFIKANTTALLGSGFDPGATNVMCALAMQEYFDEIHEIDILDCNAGDHGYAFATNFNPEINLREVSANGRYWQEGKWIETKPLEIKMAWDYPEVGVKNSYLLYHEELESLVKNIKGLKRIRFFMTFGDSYIQHMNCLQNVGMLKIEPVIHKGQEIIPIEFLKTLLPDPASLGARTKGKTNIGCVIKGVKDNKEKTIYIYNVCQHEKCYEETGAQAVSYTTGVPAAIGCYLLATGVWKKIGVCNMEEFPARSFIEQMNKMGLPIKIIEDFK